MGHQAIGFPLSCTLVLVSSNFKSLKVLGDRLVVFSLKPMQREPHQTLGLAELGPDPAFAPANC